jgi:trans-2-enoyl-CoA reductase
MKSRAARLSGFGRDVDVLRVDSVEVPDPAPHQVRVRMIASPVHPADLNVIEGKYGTLPALPATPGSEGCGEVVDIGVQVARVRVGDLVVVLTSGNWCSERVVDAADVVTIPVEIDPVQASMLVINPLTAWAMIHSSGVPVPGSWVAQNAANSAVGRCVIQIAGVMGLRTLNLVRRQELCYPLRSLGADAVCASDDEFSERAERLPSDQRPLIGLNAVGGAAALTVANVLADGGDLITYGAMARQPLKIPNGLLIFRGLQFRGFWLRRWLAETAREERDDAIRMLADWMRDGRLQIAVDQVFVLDQVHDAIAAANCSGRNGKIVLDLADGRSAHSAGACIPTIGPA